MSSYAEKKARERPGCARCGEPADALRAVDHKPWWFCSVCIAKIDAKAGR